MRKVDTYKFQGVHKRQPSGYGVWMFGDRYEQKTTMISGMYSDAKRAAIEWAKDNLGECETLYVLG